MASVCIILFTFLTMVVTITMAVQPSLSCPTMKEECVTNGKGAVQKKFTDLVKKANTHPNANLWADACAALSK